MRRFSSISGSHAGTRRAWLRRGRGARQMRPGGPPPRYLQGERVPGAGVDVLGSPAVAR